MKAKTKTKKSKTKFGRVKFAAKEANALDPDFSSLRKPIDISVSSLCQVTKLLENGSDEVKALLAYECDIIYECRVCRSLYRSLVNFISHKRVYCKEKFNITLNKTILHEYSAIFNKNSPAYFHNSNDTVFKENCTNDRILRSQVPREKSKKDLTSVIDMLHRKQTDNVDEMSELLEHVNDFTNDKDTNEHISFEFMISNDPMTYQSKNELTDCTSHILKDHQIKSPDMVNQDTSVIMPNVNSLKINQTEKSDSPVQIYGSDEENESLIDILSSKNLICTICNSKFSTKKTLTVHMRTLHTPHRICYPCPCCTSTFASTWSVYRHLFKVHRKSNDQVRKLRAQIQEKAFRKQICAIEDVQKETSKISDYMNLSGNNETQEWINHLELDVELQRCGGCGKRFDRKVALASHLQQCQKRIAVYNNVNSKLKKPTKIIKESVNDTDKSLSKNVTGNITDDLPIKSIPQSVSENKEFSNSTVSSEIQETNETSIRVQAVTSLSKADWDKINNDHPAQSDGKKRVNITSALSETKNSNNVELLSTESSHLCPTNDSSDTPEIIFTKIDKPVTVNLGSKRRKIELENGEKPVTDIIEKSIITNGLRRTNDDIDGIAPCKVLVNRLDYTMIMENKIATIANLRKLQCLPCKRKFTSMTNLRRHMAIHVGWNRYRCKLCNFKCFVKCDCVAHCNKVHNADNNRLVLAEMVIEIPQDQYACDQDIVMDISNIEKNISNSEIIDTASKTFEDTTNVNKIHSNICDTSTNIKINEKTTLVEAVSDEDKGQEDNSDADITKESVILENVVKNSNTSSETKKLDVDPDLRRMVMEVIFGSCEINVTEKDLKQSNSQIDISKDEKLHNDNEDKSVSCGNEDSKETISPSSQNDIKSQRPIRNRVKPVDLLRAH